MKKIVIALSLMLVLAIGTFFFSAKSIRDNRYKFVELVGNFEQCFAEKECQEKWMTPEAFAAKPTMELSAFASNIKTILGTRQSATLVEESLKWKPSLSLGGMQHLVTLDLKVVYENDPAVTQNISLLKIGSGPFLIKAFKINSKILSIVEDFRSRLQSDDFKQRLLATEAVSRLPPSAGKVLVPLLMANINISKWTPDQMMQANRLPDQSVEAILKIDPENALVVSEVWKLLNDPLEKANSGQSPELTLPQWVQLNNSVLALAPRKSEVAPMILQILKEDRPAGYYRIPLVVRLFLMTDAPTENLPPAIRRALLSKQPAVVGQTCQLLTSRIEMDKKKYLPDISAAMESMSGFDPNRSLCAEATSSLEPNGKMVASQYMQDLKSSDPRVRRAACENIHSLAINHQEAQVIATVPLLIKALKDENDQVRFAAGVALGGFHSKVKEIVPVLLNVIKIADGDDPSMLGAVTHSIVMLDPKSEALVATLKPHLENKKIQWRQRAARELASLGRMAKPAVPALYKILKNPSESVGLVSLAIQGLLNAGEDPNALKPLFEAQSTPHTNGPKAIAPWEEQARQNVAKQLGIVPGKVDSKLVNTLPGLQ